MAKGCAKKIVFYLVLFAFPVALWIATESVANRMTRRFEPLRIDEREQTLYVNRDYFTDFFLYRITDFMGLPLANQAVLRKKGSALRIVCLGGSTTAGYPYNTAPAFGSGASFPNYLRLILQYNHPDMPDIQMLNMGCNALNSLNIRQLVASLKRNKPDIFILYSGHNEYFGPNEFTISKEKTLIYQKPSVYFPFMRFKRTYLYQGLRSLLHKLAPAVAPKFQDYLQWSLKNGIHPEDPINLQVAENYAENIRSIIAYCREKRIPLILVQPAANLFFPPFLSLHHENLGRDIIASCDSLVMMSRIAFQQQDYQKAVAYSQAASRLDSSYAIAYFYRGMAEIALDDLASGYQNLIRARDCDGLPFRAKSFVHHTLEAQRNSQGVVLVDLPRLLSISDAVPLPHRDLFLEHVHPTQEGYYTIACLLAETLLQKKLLPAITTLRYPTFSECQAVLQTDVLHVARMEKRFPEDSFFHQLAKLNPEINGYMQWIRWRADQQIAALLPEAEQPSSTQP